MEDLQAALSNTAQTQLKEVFGNLLFTDALKSQEEISEHLSREFGKLFHTWGIHVERMELLDLMPKAQTQAVMRKQMIAERNRRAEFIRSEGKKTALRLQAEGERIVRFNLGMAQQEATKRVSEAEREARIAVAAAESAALVSVAKAATQDGSSNVQYQVSQRFMGMIQAMGSSMDSATIYLPYDGTHRRARMAHGALTSALRRQADAWPCRQAQQHVWRRQGAARDGRCAAAPGCAGAAERAQRRGAVRRARLAAAGAHAPPVARRSVRRVL